MNQAALDYIKENIEDYLDNYLNNDDPEVWLTNAIHEPAFTEIDKDILDVEDVDLSVLNASKGTSDVANIKILHDAFINLNPSFATDERLWAGLSHTYFREFMLTRWPLKELDKSKMKKSIINHWFFPTSGQRAYMINTLARYWWIGHKLYQKGYDNPYYILDFVAKDINGLLFEVFGSNYTNNPKVLKTFFDALIEYQESRGLVIDRSNLNPAKRYINLVGGKLILDVVDPLHVKKMIFDYLDLNFST